MQNEGGTGPVPGDRQPAEGGRAEVEEQLAGKDAEVDEDAEDDGGEAGRPDG